MRSRLTQKNPVLFKSLFTKWIILLLCALFFTNLDAQDSRSWQDKMMDPNVNFYEVQSSFNQFWANREYEKGKGFKQFKRWEWFMEPRVFPTGERFAPDAVLHAMQESPFMFGNNSTMPGEWSYIGNTSVPAGGGGVGRINSVRNQPGSTSVLYACAPAGGLWKSTNSGTSWTCLNTDFLAAIGVSDVAIDPVNPDIIYIATGDGDAGDTYSIGIWKSTNGGNTWNATGLNWQVTDNRTNSRLLIDPLNSNVLLAATSNGIYRTTDGGDNWIMVQSGNFKDLKFKPGDSNTVYTSGTKFYKSGDNGITWTEIVAGIPTNANRMSIAVSAADPSYVYILAGSSSNSGFLGVYRSTDSGNNFSTRSTSPNILGWNSTGSDSGGQSWYDLQIECDPANANIVFTGGVNIWKSVNGGTNWSCNAHWYGDNGLPYVHADIHSICYLPGTTHMLVGCDGGVFKTTNGGSSYSDISNNLQVSQQYRLGLSATNSGSVITGWQDNGTNLKAGSSHSQVIGGDGMECIIDPTNEQIMYGELYYGNILKSSSSGVGFSQIAGSGGSAGSVNENGAWVTPYVLGSNPQHIYVGKSTVYKSTNGGSSFVALGSMSSGNINTLAVAPSNNNFIYASKSGTLYKSFNGSTFNAVSGLPGNYITYIAIDPLNENRVWLTFSNYEIGKKVYYTANGGSSWINISGSLPNLPVNTIVYQAGSDDGLYVGTDAGVYYRDNALGDWIPYMNSLPNVVVSELEIHYGTGTLVAATYGRGTWQAPLFSLPDLDLSISGISDPNGSSCSADIIPGLIISNAGNTEITSFTLNYYVSGHGLETIEWTGSMATGENFILTLPSYNFGTGTFQFNAVLVSINGNAADDNASNNSQSVAYTVVLPPENDICSGAKDIVVNGGPVSVNTTTTCNDGPNPNCGGTNIKDVWFKFVYTGGNITIQTSLGSNNDTRLAIYNSCNGNMLACNDDVVLGVNTASILNLTCGSLVPGTTYYIQAGGYNSVAGTFTLTVTRTDIYGCTNPLACNYNACATADNGSCSVPAVNDVCSLAIPITEFGIPVAGSSLITCSNGPNPACGNSGIKDIWYSFVYTGGELTVSTAAGTLSDTRIALYESCGGAELACNDDESATTTLSAFHFPCGVLETGHTYYIQAGGFGAMAGSFFVTITATEPPEICNGIDDNCNGLTDEGLTSVFYRDADNDGFGMNSQTIQACSAPAGYVSTGTDCNDDDAGINAGITEICYNGIDDNCNGLTDENCLPPAPQNDSFDDATSIAVSTGISVCTAVNGTLVGATVSGEAHSACITGEDVWYQFVAAQKGVRIELNCSSANVLVELQDAGGTMIDSENLQTGTGIEILNFGNLIIGNTYFISVRNFNSQQGAGDFSICLKPIAASNCVLASVPYNLCTLFKAKYMGAGVSYRFDFSPVGSPQTIYTHTQSGNLIPLYIVQGLRQFNTTYNCSVTAIYVLSNGINQNEIIEVPQAQACQITLGAQPLTELRLADRCSSGPRLRNSTIAASPFICGATDYKWSFEELIGGSTPAGLTFEVLRGAATNFIGLLSIAPLHFGATYRVRIAPVYSGITGLYGPYQNLCIVGSAGMIPESDNDDEPIGLRSAVLKDENFRCSVYPNPNNGEEVNIEYVPNDHSTGVEIILFDVLRRPLFRKYFVFEGKLTTTIDLNGNLSEGILMIEFISPTQIITRPLIIEK